MKVFVYVVIDKKIYKTTKEVTKDLAKSSQQNGPIQKTIITFKNLYAIKFL